jgi:hypothetical protein
MYWCCKHGEKNMESNYWCLIGTHFIPRLVQLTMSHQIIGVVTIPVFMIVPAFLLSSFHIVQAFQSASHFGHSSQSRDRILGLNPDKSLKSFPPCYSQSTLQLCLEIYIYIYCEGRLKACSKHDEFFLHLRKQQRSRILRTRRHLRQSSPLPHP